MTSERVLIMGAAGRDYHDFFMVFRDDPSVRVVAFTHAPAQNIGELDELPNRAFPASLAGPQYEEDIPIYPESELESVVAEQAVDTVVFSYSDVSHEHVMHQASRAQSAGADFRLIGPDTMMLSAPVPVIAIDAVRTGCGKSQTARAVACELTDQGVEVAVIREPMPYGNLEDQRVLEFETMADIEAQTSTIEEREEFEGHVTAGHRLFAGIDYATIGHRAAEVADVLVWDGGNNELPFYEPTVHIVLADPHRPGDEIRYHPGETNLRIADYVLINKENTAEEKDIQTVVTNTRDRNPDATIIHANSVVSADEDAIAGKRVLVVEDGPTLTHGDAASGAGLIAARQYGAAEIIDPEPHARGSYQDIFATYTHLGPVLPAMGYSETQRRDLAATINAADPDVVVSGTPHDLSRVINIAIPIEPVTYELETKNISIQSLLDTHAFELGIYSGEPS